MAKSGHVRLWPLCPVSELGCVGLCGAVCVCGLNGHIYIWAVLLHSLQCVIYSVEMGFRVSLGCVLCVLGVMRSGVLNSG